MTLEPAKVFGGLIYEIFGLRALLEGIQHSAYHGFGLKMGTDTCITIMGKTANVTAFNAGSF
jgi:hypothetical protein